EEAPPLVVTVPEGSLFPGEVGGTSPAGGSETVGARSDPGVLSDLPAAATSVVDGAAAPGALTSGPGVRLGLGSPCGVRRPHDAPNPAKAMTKTAPRTVEKDAAKVMISAPDEDRFDAKPNPHISMPY
ncbi:MAG: hypothetical protein NTZ90_02115, partial [Proteobacteria bacterium]|nr:hypothetical protein [Pseudomonadota bacterium]